MKILYCVLLFAYIFIQFPLILSARAENKWTFLEYNRELVLRDASSYNQEYVAMAMLETTISSIVNASTPLSIINVRVYAKYSDLIAVLSARFNGSKYSVRKAVSVMDRASVEIAKVLSENTGHFLRPMFLESPGFQPTMVRVSKACDYRGEIANLNSLVTCVRKSSVPIALHGREASLAKMLHRTLSFGSYLPKIPSACMNNSSSQNSRDSAYSKTYYHTFTSKRNGTVGAPVNCSAMNRSDSVLLLAFPNDESGLNSFIQRDTDIPPIPDTSQCVGHFWYLIFFIVLIPIALCLSLVFYRCGIESGKRSIRESENDIRAGVRLSLSPWSMYGMPPRYPMHYSPGYRYNTADMTPQNQMMAPASLPQSTTSGGYHQQNYGDGLNYQHPASWKPA
ncbi:unnamed protein product [Phytomonas sp. EM1]|nr:unnamed protein product [Phytomonas sp. EM1]|eukprot:CCW62461.1 unnamed protein product [Phytomonas sp. isolate EM1]